MTDDALGPYLAEIQQMAEGLAARYGTPELAGYAVSLPPSLSTPEAVAALSRRLPHMRMRPNASVPGFIRVHPGTCPVLLGRPLVENPGLATPEIKLGPWPPEEV